MEMGSGVYHFFSQVDVTPKHPIPLSRSPSAPAPPGSNKNGGLIEPKKQQAENHSAAGEDLILSAVVLDFPTDEIRATVYVILQGGGLCQLRQGKKEWSCW